jgi:hypothetical protein
MSDKIAEIRARYAGYSLNSGNAHKANEDRGWLLAEVERLRADNEQLRADNKRLRAALTDMMSTWRYIRENYGDLEDKP